jgi:hypothetical protein
LRQQLVARAVRERQVEQHTVDPSVLGEKQRVRGATHPFGRDSFGFQPLKQSSAQIQVIFNHQDVHGESVSRGEP